MGDHLRFFLTFLVFLGTFILCYHVSIDSMDLTEQQPKYEPCYDNKNNIILGEKCLTEPITNEDIVDELQFRGLISVIIGFIVALSFLLMIISLGCFEDEP